MSAARGPAGGDDQAGRYDIRLEGYLEARWGAWFDGLTVSRGPDGTTVLSGPVADQAALHGLLNKVRDLGLPLVSVTRVGPGGTVPPAPATPHAATTPRKERER